MNFDDFINATGIEPALAKKWFPYISEALSMHKIIKIKDVAMFISQVAHESSNFKKVKESFDYTPSRLLSVFGNRVTSKQAEIMGRTTQHPADQRGIANIVYKERMGNTQIDDGWRYRGRGLLQITGRANYKACGMALHIDLINNPELLCKEKFAASSAAWFFVYSGCLEHSGNIEKITKTINGGVNGLDDRARRYKKSLQALNNDYVI